jgi:signal transduction histidine kinase
MKRDGAMKGASLTILLVEDNPGDARLIREILSDIPGQDTPAVEHIRTLAEALEYLEHFKPGIILLDLGLPDSQGLETVQRVALRASEIPIIVLTGAGDDDLAVEAIKAGAQDYMVKGLVEPEMLMRSFRYSMERKHIEEELYRHRNHLEELVRLRTRELEEKYAQLEEEIADRRRAEKEKEKLEKQLHQAQKMEALGRFAGGIAHDLNNILYPMIINTEILLEDTAPNSSLHKTLKQVLDSAYRQRDLIKQILSFSRKDDRKLEPISLSQVIQETMKFIRSALPSTIDIHLDNHAEHDTVMGDSTQIYQVLMNLCKNASDAIGGRTGAIDVMIDNTRLERNFLDLPPGEYVRIMVRDSGCGMTPEVMSQIFDPFYTTKDMGKGNGMGLSIVHGIVKSHEGAITAESEPGRGSSFIIHLPVVKTSMRRKTAAADKEPEKALKAKILLVDDEAIILSSIQTALSRMNYDVTPSSNGLEALDIFSGKPGEFDLVITDFTMPHISGMDLSNRILKMRPDIPIILCTGFNEDIDEKEVKAAGIRELLIKPTSMDDLRDAIQKALAN